VNTRGTVPDAPAVPSAAQAPGNTLRRIAITGLGAITPSGLDVATLWDSVREGRSAISRLDRPEFEGLPVRIGGQVRGFEPAEHLPEGLLPKPVLRRLDPVQHWALAAAQQALAQAVAPRPHPLDAHPTDPPSAITLPWAPDRTGIVVATGSGPVDMMQSATRRLDARGPRAVPSALAIHGAPDSAAALLSQAHGILGPAHAVSATCASGAVALTEALRSIRHGYTDAVLVVGMEDCLNPVNLASNANMRALAAGYEDEPAGASRPFDRGRRGFVMSQGAGAVLLEAGECARERDAEVLAWLVGAGTSSDAHHPTAPEPGGRGAARAIRRCLADAGVVPADVGHVNAHATGTPAGDSAELAALEDVFGPRAGGLPVTATKSTTGHLLGASGVVETVIGVLSLNEHLLPVTLNLTDPEPEHWDLVTGTARSWEPTTVLSTSFGFGGHNGAVLLAHASRPAHPTTRSMHPDEGAQP
jgi:3-oxoacyl-[acyl-carrier-protein] synthase II